MCSTTAGPRRPTASASPAPAAVVRLTQAGRRAYPDEVISAHRRAAAFFDLDKTIIARSSTLAFSRPFYAGGLINRRAVLRSAYAQFVYLVGGADHDQMERMRDYLSVAVRRVGRRSRSARSSPRPSHDIVDPIDLRRGGRRSSRSTTRPGATSSSCRTTGAEVVEPIGATARRRPRHRDPDGRSRTAATPARSRSTPTARTRPTPSGSSPSSEGYDLAESYAYSDSFTDLPMLEARRAPVRRQPRPRAAARRRRPRLAGARLHPAGSPAPPLPRPAGRRRLPAHRRRRRGRHGVRGLGRRHVGSRQVAAGRLGSRDRAEVGVTAGSTRRNLPP